MGVVDNAAFSLREWRREREEKKEEGKGGGEIRAEPLIPPTFIVRGARMEA